MNILHDNSKPPSVSAIVSISSSDLQALVRQVVITVLEQIRETDSQFGNRITYSEAEAATLLGIERHVLRDCRLREEIVGSRVGKRTIYSRETLLRFLSDRRIQK